MAEIRLAFLEREYPALASGTRRASRCTTLRGSHCIRCGRQEWATKYYASYCRLLRCLIVLARPVCLPSASSLTPERRFGSVAQDNATVFGVNETVAMSEAQRESTGVGGFARFFVRLVAPYWRHILVVLLAMAPAVAYTAVYPLILQALIDQAIIPGQGAVAVSLITGLVALLVLTWVGDVLHQYLVARLVADAGGNALRLRVFQHLQDLQVRAYARFEGGDILARCMAGAEAIEQALTLVFSNLLPQVATIIVGGAVLFWIEWHWPCSAWRSCPSYISALAFSVGGWSRQA